ncbi:MAG TPA: hypothetical protein VFA08_12690 [Actinomycetota bacterium]|nr:hypothetical protein [Actinomycetota bacterium]
MTSTRRARRLRRALVAGGLALAMISSACAGSDAGSDPRSSPPEQERTSAPVRELTSIGALRDAFNDDAGSSRLILLISPT